MKYSYEENPYYAETDSNGKWWITTKLSSLPSMLDRAFDTIDEVGRAIKAQISRDRSDDNFYDWTR